jgi:hypothetical protein
VSPGGAKTRGGQARGGVTRDGGSPGVSKSSEDKATDFESMVGQGMKRSLGAKPRGGQSQPGQAAGSKSGGKSWYSKALGEDKACRWGARQVRGSLDEQSLEVDNPRRQSCWKPAWGEKLVW